MDNKTSYITLTSTQRRDPSAGGREDYGTIEVSADFQPDSGEYHAWRNDLENQGIRIVAERFSVTEEELARIKTRSPQHDETLSSLVARLNNSSGKKLSDEDIRKIFGSLFNGDMGTTANI